MLGFVFAAFLVCLFPVITTQVHRWNSVRPVALIPATAWLVATEDGNENTCGAEAPITCFANSKNPGLWESKINRNGSQAKRLKQEKKKKFWLGATLSKEQIATAEKEGASQLVIGWINARYTVWLNGKKTQSGSWDDTEPIIIPLSLIPSSELQDLKIAIYLNDEFDHARPDQLTYSFGQSFGEGLYTKRDASSYRSLMTYASTVRPIILLFANLCAALVFILIWSFHREKQEYYFLSLFTLIGSLQQLAFVGYTYGIIDPGQSYLWNYWLVLNEGLMGLLLGLSFARIAKKILPWIALGSLSITALSIFLPYTPLSFYRFSIFFNDRINPTLFLIGGLACLYQIRVMRADSAKKIFSLRIVRLSLFATGMIALSSIDFYEGFFWYDLSVLKNLLFYRFGHFALTVYLGFVTLREYKQQVLLVKKTPVSTYHKRPFLPEQVSGIILSVDLRNSEWLFRAGAEMGDSGALGISCLTTLWEAVVESGGFILQTNGDGLIAFFDKTVLVSPANSALDATDAMASKLDSLFAKFKDQGYITSDTLKLKFRAALASGEIKPIWQEMGNQRLASWTETGDQNAFVTVSRLMDLERGLLLDGNQTLMLEELAKNLDRSFLIRNKKLVGKHDLGYEVAVYSSGRPLSLGQKIIYSEKTKTGAL
jgi:hypothetical protein